MGENIIQISIIKTKHPLHFKHCAFSITCTLFLTRFI